MTTATKTLAAIEEGFNKDEGSLFRQWQAHTLPQCKDAYDPDNSPFRNHLGASVIGRKCQRALQHAFRWAAREKPKPHMQRLWNRGHLEEGRMLAILHMIGVQVRQHDPQTGNQIRISDHWGYFGGSSDGHLFGVPDIPNEWILGEFKTHNDKSFAKLTQEGLIAAKYEHYVQMNIYMRKMGLRYGLYLAVNKNDDRIHGEIVGLNADVADRYIERAKEIICADKPLKQISDSPAWHECKWCEFRALCHFKAKPLVNCRTCANIRLLGDGKWGCGLANGQEIPKAVQFTGCKSYEQNNVLWNTGHTK